MIEPPLLSNTIQAVADISAADVVTKATGAIFGKPLVLNVWRAMLVESPLDLVLPSDWTWCSTDYASYDFRHTDGTRLEVKQSAALQSWTKIGGKTSRASFDIGTRTGAWDGPTWNPSETPIRNADLYVMAHHPIVDETADHRNPHQWLFYVIPTNMLPATRSIVLNRLRAIVPSVALAHLVKKIEDSRIRF